MTNRKLLELAAKAAGIELMQFEIEDGVFEEAFRTNEGYWNPLTDDGDELRLEVALKFTAAWEPMRGGWSIGGIVDGEFRWLAVHADRRTAGTRAAAEIGKRIT